MMRAPSFSSHSRDAQRTREPSQRNRISGWVHGLGFADPMMAIGFMILSFALVPAAALAGTPVDLKAQLMSHGANVTLGDIFDGLGGSAADQVVAHAAQPGLDAVLDAETVQTLAHRAGYDWANASGFRRIVVSSQVGETEPTGSNRSAHAKAVRRGRVNQVLTYARNLMAGDILSADDLVWSDEAVAPYDSLNDPEAAMGKAARHALRPGRRP
jgi:flagella basal body P-ring formation protein FlgA